MDFVAEETSAYHPSETPCFFRSENIIKNHVTILFLLFIAEASNM